MSSNVLDAIRQGEVQDKAAAADQYREMVRQLARGESPDVDDVRRVLQLLSKTPDDMQADVAKQERRIELLDFINESEGMQEECIRCRAEINDAKESRKALEKASDEKLRSLQSEMNQLQRTIRKSNEAKAELKKTCDDPGLLSRAESVRGQFDAANRRLGELRTERRGVFSHLEQEQREPVPDVAELSRQAEEQRKPIPDVVELSRLAGLSRRIEQLQTLDRAIPELETRRDQLAAEMKEIELAMVTSA